MTIDYDSRSPIYNLLKFAKNLRWANVIWSVSGSQENTGEQDRYGETIASSPSMRFEELGNSEIVAVETNGHNAISSLVNYRPGYHKPVLDLDIPATLVPSSSNGHSHLVIDMAMSWEDYKKLLITLFEVGILEQGYVSAALRREATWIRAPWEKKFQPIPESDF